VGRGSKATIPKSYFGLQSQVAETVRLKSPGFTFPKGVLLGKLEVEVSACDNSDLRASLYGGSEL
jgi:hypothetical protein